MENYLMLKGKKIDLTDEQVKEIKSCFDFGNVKLGVRPFLIFNSSISVSI